MKNLTLAILLTFAINLSAAEPTYSVIKVVKIKGSNGAVNNVMVTVKCEKGAAITEATSYLNSDELATYKSDPDAALAACAERAAVDAKFLLEKNESNPEREVEKDVVRISIDSAKVKAKFDARKNK